MGPRLPALIALCTVLVLASCAGSLAAPPSPGANGCRPGPPEAGVHNPDRLHVLAACMQVAGTAVDVAHEDDGDFHVWFKVDPGFEFLLNAENHFQGRPAMLAEITPDCPPDSNPPDAVAAAHCPASSLPVPAIGDHVSIAGPWVFDADHGWNEIHPVDSIRIIGGG